MTPDLRVFEWSEAPEAGDAADYAQMYPDAATRLQEDLQNATSFTDWTTTLP